MTVITMIAVVVVGVVFALVIVAAIVVVNVAVVIVVVIAGVMAIVVVIASVSSQKYFVAWPDVIEACCIKKETGEQKLDQSRS